MGISGWNKDERPRERLLQKGAGSLSNAELLAILIGSGTREKSAVDLMKEVLDSVDGSLRKLGLLGYDYLKEFKGIGPAKAVTILAACELSRRRMETEDPEKECFDTSKKVFEGLLRSLYCNLVEEQCWMLMFDNRMGFVARKKVGEGGLTDVSVDKRVILREALLKNANKIILSHNHPSGGLAPSRQDDNLTEEIRVACRMMGVVLVDHIIVAGSRYYSYAEAGKL